MPTSTLVPATPTQLNARIISPVHVELTWTLVADALTVSIQRSADGITWATDFQVSGNCAFASVPYCTPATTYQFRVLASNAIGDSPLSNVVSVTMPALILPPLPFVLPPPPPPPLPLGVPGIFWGALQPAPWSVAQQTAFDTLCGKAASLVQIPQSLIHGGVTRTFPTATFEAIRLRGCVPMLTLFLYDDQGSGTIQPLFTSALIASGKYDAQITSLAQGAQAWGHPFFLNVNPEMNGPWHLYCDEINGNKPGDFALMMTHVRKVFAPICPNASWVFCPNTQDSPPRLPIANYYAGDSVYEWRGFDGYNPFPLWWQSFAQVVDVTYRALNALGAPKPIFLCEHACPESGDGGAQKAAWITDAYLKQLITTYSLIRGVCWYQLIEATDWRINSTTPALTAFQAAVADKHFALPTFQTLPSGPIAPPTT